MGEFVVIGLGRFGGNVALNLARSGNPVLGIDINEDVVQKISAELDTVVRADATDEEALLELGLQRMSCAVVALGADAKEASILATALLRQMGVPRIVARALTDLHARVLRTIGAHQVINPDAEMGVRLARQLAQPNVLERFDLGDNAQVAELTVPESFVGKTLQELDLRREYGFSVVATRRQGTVKASVDGNDRFESGDILVIVGTPAAIRRVSAIT